MDRVDAVAHILSEHGAIPKDMDAQLAAFGFEPVKDGVEYLDVTKFNVEMAKRVVALEQQVGRVAELLAEFAERQVKMRADLIRSGAFEKKSSIIMPGDLD